MGCRPSKQATSKVRAVDESLCLCSPKKVRKNHKCSSSSAKSAAMGSKKHSLSSGHKPRTLETTSMDFPAFSTTTAVYRKSASKTSKITLRLSCDGSTLEIEQCDYDLEKGYGDLTPTPRPWHSAPNLTYLKDKKSRLFRENPMKHSKSSWSPSVSSTVSGFLAMRVPAIINAVENQPSNKSLAVSRPSSNDSQADCGSSNERCNTGRTPLLRTGGKINTAFGYKNPSSFYRNPDGDQSTCTSNNENAQQRLISMGKSSVNNLNSREYTHNNGKTTQFKTITKHHEAPDDSEFLDFEHIPVNLITSFAPPLPSEKSYRLTDSNHNQFRLNDCCMQNKETKSDANIASHFRSFTCSQQISSDTQNISGVYRINNFSSHEALSLNTSRDSSPDSCDSQIDSHSIMTFVALGCPVPNKTSNCSYFSDDEDAISIFSPRQEVTVLQDLFCNEDLDVDALSSRDDALSRGLCTQSRNRFGNRWEGLHAPEHNTFRTLKPTESLQDRSKYCNGFTNTKLASYYSKVVKKDYKQEWIDGELRVVKDNENALDTSSGLTAECWSNVKFPLMKTHIPASAVLQDFEETNVRDQLTNNNVDISPCNSREKMAEETIHLCFSGDSSAWRSNHSMEDDLVKNAAIDEETRGAVSVEKKRSAGVAQMYSPRLGKMSLTAESVNSSSEEKSIDVSSERMNPDTLESENSILELTDFQLNEDNELCFNTTNVYKQSQMTFMAKNSDNSSITTLQNDQDNPSSLSGIEQIISLHYRGDTDEVGSSSFNFSENQEFHGELDTFTITPDSQKADYLMDLLISDTSNATTKLYKESILYCGFDNFMENGTSSLTESSESESGLIWFKEFSRLSRPTESHTREILQAPVRPTNIDLVKINILNTNLNSLDTTYDSIYNQRASPTFVKSKSPDTSFTYHNKSMSQNLSLTNGIKARDQRDKTLFKHHNSTSVTFDHLTFNDPFVDVHSLGGCKNLKTAPERSTGDMNDFLNSTTHRAALQSGGQPHRSGIMPHAQDTTSSTIQTCLCPLAPSSSQAEWDFKGKSESMNTSSKLPHSIYCERNLNEKNIDPSEITYLDLGENSQAFLALPSHLNRTQFVHIAHDSSKCQVKPFLCKTGPQKTDCASYDGGHMGQDSIYIEKNNFFRTCDCTCDCKGQEDCLCKSNISTSQTGSYILSKSTIDRINGLPSQNSEGRLQNLKQAAMDNDLNDNDCGLMGNSATGCQTKSLNSNINNYCNELFPHCNNGHYIDTVGYPEHYMDFFNACHTMEHNGIDLHNETMNQSKTYQNNERAEKGTKSISNNQDQHHCYTRCLEQSNNQETKQDAYVYLAGASYMGRNSYHERTDSFNVDTVDVMTTRFNHPFKRKAKQTPSSHSSSDKQEMLILGTKRRLPDNDVCKRQTQTDLIFQEYAYYRHFSETNHSETIPRNNVLSLVRYFEKVPFSNNNAK